MSAREAMQMALDALNLPSLKTQEMLRQRDETIATLRAALAEEALQRLTDVQQEIEAVLEQPEQEPVAWIQPGLRDWLCVSYDRDSVHTVPVYPHPPPPQRKPLTEEEIRRMKPISPDLVDFRSGVRCAEAAHGIKGEV